MSVGLQIAPDAWVVIDGDPYKIVSVDAAKHSVTLCGQDDSAVVASLGWLLEHPAVEPFAVPAQPAPRSGLSLVNAAPRHALTRAEKRLRHVREVETGYQSGNPDDGTTPDPRYDPVLVPKVTDRRKAKAAELALPTTDPDLKMSYRTLEREAAELRASNPENLIDGRACRVVNGTWQPPEVLDAIEDVVAERKKRSNFQTLEGMAELVRLRVKRDHPDDWQEILPTTNKSIIRAAQAMFTPTELTKGKAKHRRTKLENTGKPAARVSITRPGQVLMGDVKDLDVLLKNTVFEGAEGTVRGRLIMWMDGYSRSIPEFRIVLESEKGVDIAQSILACGRPKLMEPGWADDIRWPFVGVPENVVNELAGGTVAGVPFMDPENLLIDNGRPYRSFVNVATARKLGTGILAARQLRPTDKAGIERAFRTLDTQLCQFLRGYRGPDPSERGDNVEAEARYSYRDLEAIIRHWIAAWWQRRPLPVDVRPAWFPNGKNYSPNQMFNYGIQQTGLKLRFLAPQEYASALPTRKVKLRPRGFQVLGFWYDVEPRDGLDGRPPQDPLQRWRKPDRRDRDWNRKHEVAYDPRDMRHVWWQDPRSGTYIRLRWRGGFGLDETPVFNDKDVEAVLAIAKERRLDPLDSAAMAQVLFSLLSFHDPHWNEDLPLRDRKAAARREQQGESAARDRAAGMAEPEAGPASEEQRAPVTAREQHEQIVQRNRQKAREAAGVVGGNAPAVLGSTSDGLFSGLEDVAASPSGDRGAAPVIPIRSQED